VIHERRERIPKVEDGAIMETHDHEVMKIFYLGSLM
jgi:hypothetical protein